MYLLGVEAFLAIVRTQNICRAAEQLNLAQSTVSKRLNVLERELGSTLIERGKGLKTIGLTPAGTAFVDLAERWEGIWRETQRLTSGGPQLFLSIGTLHSLSYTAFSTIYRELVQHQPRISLRLITSHSQELYEAVERRHVDVAFVIRERASPNVVVEKCFTEPLVGLRLATPTRSSADRVHPQEIDPNHELYIRWGPGYEIWHDKWWSPNCSGRIRLDNVHLLTTFLYHERQWAIVPQSVANTAITSHNFYTFHLSEAPPDRICYKLTHKHPKASSSASLKVLDHYLSILLDKEYSFYPKTINEP